ncbi:MAG: peptidylprolyl isomerase [Polyangiaceae bacterium]
MTRWSFALGVLAATLLSVVVVAKTPWEVHPLDLLDASPEAAASPTTVADAATVAPSVGVVVVDAGDVAPPELPDAAERVAVTGSGPRSVRAGVILVAYAGAEGAGSTARSRDAARALADSLATAARSDFKAAVARGDSGSVEDIGRIPRGVLEKAVESELFALPVGDVSAVVDTPRGYWIAKRLE